MKPALKIVHAPAATPYDAARGKKRIAALRNSLLQASIRYVREGDEGTRHDRLRAASDLSGIPRTLIEVSLK